MKLFSKKQRKSKVDSNDKGFEVKRKEGGRGYTIMSYTIQNISPNEIEAIISIIDEELQNDCKRIGQNIAERIVKESGIHKISSAQVSGQNYGVEWIVKISSNPFEFID